MTYKYPPENDEHDDSEYPREPDDSREDPQGDDPVSPIYGPSQRDMDRSWDDDKTDGTNQRSGSRGSIWKYLVLGVSLVILASMAFGIAGPLVDRSRIVEPAQRAQPERVTASVLRVVDARTIVVRTGGVEQTVRLIGIENPLFGDSLTNFAREVSQSWIGGQDVLLESDERDTDLQGRLLRYVYFDNVMINAALILNGLGKTESEHPNIRYSRFLADMQRQAQEAGVGYWDPARGEPGLDARSSNTEASLRNGYYSKTPTS